MAETARVAVIRSILRDSATVPQIVNDNETRKAATVRQAIQKNCHAGYIDVRFISVHNEVGFEVSAEGMSFLKRSADLAAKSKK